MPWSTVPPHRSGSSAPPIDRRRTRVVLLLAQKVDAALNGARIARNAAGDRRPLIVKAARDELFLCRRGTLEALGFSQYRRPILRPVYFVPPIADRGRIGPHRVPHSLRLECRKSSFPQAPFEGSTQPAGALRHSGTRAQGDAKLAWINSLCTNELMYFIEVI